MHSNGVASRDYLKDTNALAYFSECVESRKKIYVKLTPDVKILELSVYFLTLVLSVTSFFFALLNLVFTDTGS